MIKTKNLVPDVYYQESRDFQLIGRTYEALFNYIKTNADMVGSNPLSENSDDRLLDLLSLTLGFKSKHNYNHDQLRAMCYSLAEILKYKGTKKAIELALKVVMNVENVKTQAQIVVDPVAHKVTIWVANEIGDLNLFYDLLDYILPAGMSFNIYKTILQESKATTRLKETSVVVEEGRNENTTSVVASIETEISQGMNGAIDNSTVVRL